MKRYKYLITSLLLSFFLLSSCEDAYEIVQDGELNESDLKTIDDMQAYLNASVYGSLSISNEIGFTGVFTDETGVGRGSGGQNFNTHRFIVNTGDPYAGAIWYGQYSTINRVNRLMRIAETQVGVPTDASQLQVYNSIIAQAKAIRAFCYFDLLTYFSTDLSDNNATGVMLFTNVPGADDKYPRSTNGEVFAQIEEDLNAAYDKLYYSDIAAESQYKYVTNNMINALRARMYLYRKNYPLAKQYAQQVINESGLSLTVAGPISTGTTAFPTDPNANVRTGFAPWKALFYGSVSPPATTPSPYKKMFSDFEQGEIIFGLDRPAAGPWGNICSQFTTNSTNAAGSPLWEVGRNLFNKLRSNPGDIRRWVFVDPTSFVDVNYATNPSYLDSDVLVIDKYCGKANAVLRNDEKIFRLSEMYFILAECYANEGNINGDTNSVASVLKQIRDARNYINTNQPLPVYANATDAIADILYERQLELCYEGHRYIDLKRLGALANVTLQRDPTDDIIQTATTLPNGDYRFTLPIPADELVANPTIQQNPNY